MKKVFLKLATVVTIIGLLPFLFSCSSTEDEITPTANELAATDPAIAQSEVNEIISFANDAMDNGTGRAKFEFSFCATFTHDKATKTIVLDFGTTGCGNKITRTGKITITYNGEPSEKGTRSITFENYTFNGKSLNGSVTVTGIKTNGNNNPEMTITITDLVLTKADGKTVTLNSNQTYEWTAGAGNQNPLDDVFQITGSSSGAVSDGSGYAATITSPLVFKSDCLATKNPYPVSGSQNIAPTGDTPFSIDYGSGDCDKKATITIGRIDREIDLP